MRTPTLTAFVGAAALATAVSPTVASAAPHRGDNATPARAAIAPAPVTATTLADWTFGHTEYVLRQITVAPGASTGWHAHNGQLHGYVQTGALTHVTTDCTVAGVVPHGHTFTSAATDPASDDRNLGRTPLVMDLFYILPAGQTINIPAPDPGCGF
jgi:hypothetical protein